MASLSIGDGFSKHFYLWPGELADVYVDIERMTQTSRSHREWQMQPKDYGFGQKDTLTAEHLERNDFILQKQKEQSAELNTEIAEKRDRMCLTPHSPF